MPRFAALCFYIKASSGCLLKGYMFTQINDKIVKSIKDVSVGDQVKLKSYDGEAVAKILEVKNDI